MVVIVVSKEETKFKDESTHQIWHELVDITERNGIPSDFLSDSKSSSDGIEQVVDRLYDLISGVKWDKELIQLYRDGKKMEKLIAEQEGNKK